MRKVESGLIHAPPKMLGSINRWITSKIAEIMIKELERVPDSPTEVGDSGERRVVFGPSIEMSHEGPKIEPNEKELIHFKEVASKYWPHKKMKWHLDIFEC